MNDHSSESASRKLTIAIDGPAGAGKSTIASRLARKLGYVNLESGAMYRALALKAIEKDASFDDEAALVKLAQTLRIRLGPTSAGTALCSTGAMYPRAFVSATFQKRRRGSLFIPRSESGWLRTSGKWVQAAAW